MNKLEQLKQQVAEMFKGAETKESIEQLGAINNTIAEIGQEEEAMVKKHGELMASYKEAIMHQSYETGSNSMDPVPTPKVVSFEDSLEQFMSKKK